MKIKKLFLEFLTFLTVFSLFPMKKYVKTELVMGTILNIQIFSAEKNASDCLNGAFQLASRYDRVFSSKQKYGEVYQLNQCGFCENMEIYAMLKEADFYYKLTGGAFDYTLFPLIRLWHIEDATEPPPAVAIAEVLNHCGTEKVTFAGDRVLLQSGAAIDLGGIAKGKILSLIADYLKEYKVSNFMINAGGDIVLSGLFNGKRQWNVAIKDPFPENDILGYIQLTNKIIVTSGDYERFFVGSDGVRYHHILHPATGYPARSGVSSVSVISSDPVRADALSTALFVMGKDAGLSFLRTQEDAEAIFVEKENDKEVVSCSSGISCTWENGARYFSVKTEE